MPSHFRSFLLFIALLAFLNACSTVDTRPAGESFPEKDLPSRQDSREKELPDQLEGTRWSPYKGSLARAIELSDSMSAYQPDLVLDILRSLEPVPSGQLKAMIDEQVYDPGFTQWLELAVQVRATLISGSPVAAAANHWASEHYGHVVTGTGFSRLVSDYSAYFPEPSRVAVLLPTEGGLSAAGNAIRDGILSAYLDRPGESVIRFYSSGENSEAAIAAYLQARQDGATQIVGPLRIESARALAGLADLDVPVLLLNEVGGEQPVTGTPTAAVNSLSLSQTEEAEAVARSSLEQGQDQALVIVPDSAWGARVETAFTTVYEKGGGRISATARFNPETRDQGDMLTQVLRIDESKQRKEALQQRLGGIPLDFEPIRRNDFDFVLMAANPAQGRELKPLLLFHDVGDIPVYAMGRIFSGKVEQGADQDLNGIIFPTTPWQLQSGADASLSLASLRDGALGDLHALGRDAWHLLKWLPLMQKDPDLWFPGEIGALRMQANGRLYRAPTWAQFSGGRPVLYQWPGSY